MATHGDGEGNQIFMESSGSRPTNKLCAFISKYYPPEAYRKIIAEVIATFLLVFATAGAAAISGSDQMRIPKLGASIVGGLIVTVMIYAVGHISGAHMNPAVTTAFAVGKHFPWNMVPLYWVAQFTGSICASFLLKWIVHPIHIIGVTAPSGSHLHAFVLEIVITFIMMFVTCAVATDYKAVGELAGVAVGSSVCIASVFGGPISGGSMNPARTFGPALASSYYKGLWVYFIGPPIGTILATIAYQVVRPNEKTTHATSSIRIRRQKTNEGSQV